MEGSSFCSAHPGGPSLSIYAPEGTGHAPGREKKKAQERNRQFPAGPTPCSRLKGSFYSVSGSGYKRSEHSIYDFNLPYRQNFFNQFWKDFKKISKWHRESPLLLAFLSIRHGVLHNMLLRGKARREQNEKRCTRPGTPLFSGRINWAGPLRRPWVPPRPAFWQGGAEAPRRPPPTPANRPARHSPWETGCPGSSGWPARPEAAGRTEWKWHCG